MGSLKILKIKSTLTLIETIVNYMQCMLDSDNGAKFPLTPMGVLAPGSAHARPSDQPPINTSGNFLAQVSGNI